MSIIYFGCKQNGFVHHPPKRKENKSNWNVNCFMHITYDVRHYSALYGIIYLIINFLFLFYHCMRKFSFVVTSTIILYNTWSNRRKGRNMEPCGEEINVSHFRRKALVCVTRVTHTTRFYDALNILIPWKKILNSEKWI